jgi:hypothetical protein
MNGTFQLIRRARSEGCSLRPPQTCEAGGIVACVRPAPPDPARTPEIEEPLHTGSIYRELMQKYDRYNSRHLK